MSTSHTTAFIVDDDPAIRDALTLMLEQENMTVKAFESAEAFLNSYQPDCKGCAIIDIRMPGMDGMALHQVLLARNIVLPVIFLTGHGDIPMSVQAIKAGAVDFLTKPVTREKLLASVKAAVELSETMLSHHTCHQNAVSKLATLTDRERDVMQLAVLGHTNKHIARELGISHRTVEIHKSKIMYKTGAQNLLDLVRIAHESE